MTEISKTDTAWADSLILTDDGQPLVEYRVDGGADTDGQPLPELGVDAGQTDDVIGIGDIEDIRVADGGGDNFVFGETMYFE